MNLEQRIKRLEEAVIQKQIKFNEDVDYSNIDTIKFKGGTFRRFDRTDWSGWSGANTFPDGSNPFIAEGVTVNSKMRFALEDSFGESFEDEAVVIFDYSDKKYTLCIQYFTEEFQAYCLIVQFAEFSQAQWWIKARLGDELNEPQNIREIEAY